MRITNKTHGKKIKKILKRTKSFRGKSNNCYRLAIIAYKRSLVNEYIGRKLKKRNIKQVWIKRINAWARNKNSNYSQVITKIRKVNISRKLASFCIVNDIDISNFIGL